MKAIFVSFSVLVFCSSGIASDRFEELRDRFEEIRLLQPKVQVVLGIFREMTELDDPRVVPYLLEEAEKYRVFPAYPDFKQRDITGGQYAGLAQVALAMMGHEESFMQLFEQSFHENKVIRYNALGKIELIDGPIGVALLSNFMGDDDTAKGRPWTVLEIEAAFALSRKLERPPFVFVGEEFPYGVNWAGEAREAYYRWRYETYGPVPGREELFKSFSDLVPGHFPGVKDMLKVSQNSDSSGVELPQAKELPVGSFSHKGKSLAWLIALAGAVFLAIAARYWIRRR